MNSMEKFYKKESLANMILSVLCSVYGWSCPEHHRYALYINGKGGELIPEHFGTIAQKGDWSFVLWNHSPYVKELPVPKGKNWALYYTDRLIDAGRNLKPPESVVKRVVAKAEMPVAKLVAMVLASS